MLVFFFLSEMSQSISEKQFPVQNWYQKHSMNTRAHIRRRQDGGNASGCSTPKELSDMEQTTQAAALGSGPGPCLAGPGRVLPDPSCSCTFHLNLP